MTALILIQLHLPLNETHSSMNSFVRMALQYTFNKVSFLQPSLKAEIGLNNPAILKAINLGSLKA